MAKAIQKALIQDPRAKHVTFSKRRYGIFKKASELCTLCAVEMTIIVFSPGGKTYSFGHPSPNAIINRFTNSVDSNASAIGEDQRSQKDAVVRRTCKRYSDLNAQLNAEKKRGEDLKRMMMMKIPDIDKMNRDELLQFKASLEDLKLKVFCRKMELLTQKPVDLSLTLGGIYSTRGNICLSQCLAP